MLPVRGAVSAIQQTEARAIGGRLSGQHKEGVTRDEHRSEDVVAFSQHVSAGRPRVAAIVANDGSRFSDATDAGT